MAKPKPVHLPGQPGGAVPARNQQQSAVQVTQTIARSGPLPDAEQMAKYGQISPELPLRIMQMAEKEQESRVEELRKESARQDEMLTLAKMEAVHAETLLKINGRNTLLGLVFAFFAFLALVVGAVLCTYWKLPVPAGFLGAGGLAMVIVAFITGSKIRAVQSPPKADQS